MPSFRTVFLAAAAALFSTAAADYVIDPGTVPIKTRERWCSDQEVTCPMLCQQVEPGTTLVNTCDPESLTYGCICGNNLQPNVSEYTLTLPFHTCTQWQQNCISDCGNHNNPCIASCTQDHPCGAQNPTRVNLTSTAATTTVGPASSATGDTVFDGPGSSTGDGSGDDGSGAAALELGSRFGLAVVLGTLALGFGILG